MSQYRAGLRVSEYVLEEPLGAGTFGEVWQARHHVWDSERVAIKLPTEPEYVRYLQHEGVVVHGLRHPNIVRVIGLDPYADPPYLVMELVRGPSLRQVISDHPRGMDIPIVLTVLRGILNGLAAAHAAHIVHRDLKPGNILLNLDGRPVAELRPEDVKIGDFGFGVANADALHSIVMQSASIEREARNNALTGTLAYMAPEVRDGEQAPSPRSDLYALGVILHEMLTGERPVGTDLPSTLRPDVPPLLDEIFRRLYARVDRRYESAAAVLSDLETHRTAARRAAPAEEPPSTGAVRTPPRCPACDTPTEPGDQFCTQCGRQLVARVRRCASCGAFPGPEDRFCIFCGRALSWEG
jgi:serine/threonine protein kinase